MNAKEWFLRPVAAVIRHCAGELIAAGSSQANPGLAYAYSTSCRIRYQLHRRHDRQFHATDARELPGRFYQTNISV